MHPRCSRKMSTGSIRGGKKIWCGELNRRLGRRMLNSYDIQAVRRQHRLDERPDFVFNLPGAGRRYSPAAADWIMDQYGRDPEFFQHARPPIRKCSACGEKSRGNRVGIFAAASLKLQPGLAASRS